MIKKLIIAALFVWGCFCLLYLEQAGVEIIMPYVPEVEIINSSLIFGEVDTTVGSLLEIQGSDILLVGLICIIGGLLSNLIGIAYRPFIFVALILYVAAAVIIFNTPKYFCEANDIEIMEEYVFLGEGARNTIIYLFSISGLLFILGLIPNKKTT